MATELSSPPWSAYPWSVARPRLGTPFELVLPSGRRASVLASAKRLEGALPSDLAQAIEVGAVTCSPDPWTLPLADANVIEVVLASIGAVAAPPVPLSCRNCGEQVEVDAAAALPIAPLLTPPGDPELDPPVDLVQWHPLPRPIEVGRRGPADRFRLGRRTLRDRVRLEEILGDDDRAPLPLGAPLVRALGLEALGEGDPPRVATESAMAIARALEALDDDMFTDAWDAITRAWDHQHWPPRLLAPTACPTCGARHDVEVVQRTLDWMPPRAQKTAEEEFPSLEAFTARAAAITREVLGAGARGLEVMVEDGVPPCDDGGEPLLGSYTPHLPNADGTAAVGDARVHGAPFVIALYYRTFRSMWDDEPYDVDAEIRETIEHELEHHENFLSGHDPLDEEERAAIADEHRRLRGRAGVDELAASAGWLASDFARFVRLTWPVWLIVLFALLIVFAGER